MVNKESIAVRCDGLFGLGNAGWDSLPSFEDIEFLIKEAESKLGILTDKFSLVDERYYDVKDLPLDLSWCKTEYGSITLPSELKVEAWSGVRKDMFKQADSDYKEIVSDLLSGTLSPVLIYEDYGLVAGKDRVLFANALAIPVRLFILKRDE